MKLKLITYLFSCLTTIGIASAQSLIVNKNINLPQDSTVKALLISSLNNFIIQKEKAGKDNAYILKEQQLETLALIDEMKGAEKNTKLKDDNFYKCYLTNVTKLNNADFIVEIAYMAIIDNKPVLHAGFKLLAKKLDNRFCFYAPLKKYTASWKSKRLNYITYYYKDTLNIAGAKAYLNTVSYYDKKLKAPASQMAVYYCDDFTEVLQLLGVVYKEDYNGIANGSLGAHDNNQFLTVNGAKPTPFRFDPHDLWHDRLRTVLTNDVINRPVDEGCAYLYGGSWGLTWPEILSRFKKYVKENPKADWLQLYTDGTNFSPGPKILKISYVLNALVAEDLEKNKGFEAVMSLLSCGKKENGDENYFIALEKLTGISKINFNTAMSKLINKQ